MLNLLSGEWRVIVKEVKINFTVVAEAFACRKMAFQMTPRELINPFYPFYTLFMALSNTYCNFKILSSFPTQ